MHRFLDLDVGGRIMWPEHVVVHVFICLLNATSCDYSSSGEDR